MNKIIAKDDLNAFFGLLMNNLTNLLVLTSLLIFVVGLPREIVYENILPGIGVSLFFASVYYTYMGYKLRRDSNNPNVTALPSGISVPHMYLIVFVVVGPVYWSTNDPYLAWYTGISWCFIEGIIELVGASFGKKLKDVIPRPALLGSLAGVSLTFILLNPSFSIFAVPYIGLVTFTFVLLSLFGRVRMPFNLPVGLLAIIFGILLGYFTRITNMEILINNMQAFSINPPRLSFIGLVEGFKNSTSILAIAVPFGIYNFIETIDNVESAEAAGDKYNLTETLIVDGLSTIVGSLMGSAFPIAVYIGHPGWKKTNAKIGYTLMTGIAILFITITGSIEILLSLIPIVAIEPILIYIGITITTQAFETSETKHYPAIILSFIPWLADWSKNVVDIAFNSANLDALNIGLDIINESGLNYRGMSTLGAGSIIVSIIWGTMLVFIIDNKFGRLAVTSAVATILSFVGIIHSSVITINANQDISISYFIMLIIFLSYYIKEKRGKENEKNISRSKAV